MPKNGTVWPVRPSRVNEGAVDTEPMPRASNEAQKDEGTLDEATTGKADTPSGEEQEG